MVYILIRLLRSIWQEILLPHVLLGMAALVTDGLEAWRDIGQTLYVLFFFFKGKSHRKFPLSKILLADCKHNKIEKRIHAMRNDEKPKGLPPGSSVLDPAYEKTDTLTDEHNSFQLRSNKAPRHAYISDGFDATHSTGDSTNESSEINVLQKMKPLLSPSLESRPKPLTSSCGNADESSTSEAGSRIVMIQRRVLFGRKGEHQMFLAEVPGRILVPLDFLLNYSKTLHTLVSCVIGPIQQPNVSTLPTRHPAPQWPPHYVRSSGSANLLPGNSIGAMAGTSSFRYDDRHLERQGDTNSSAADGFTSSSAWGHTQEFRQASSVVYRRVSSRKLDFLPSRTSPAHPIASITSHHVLSYQATRQKVLVVDLDETLCHVSMSTANMLGPPTFSEVIPTASGAELFHVWVRPYARTFLTTMAKLFNIVLFTAASKSYADTILSRIDLDHVIKKRYYRQNCRIFSRGMLAKTMPGLRCGTIARSGAFDSNISHPCPYASSESGDRSAPSPVTGTLSDSSSNTEGNSDFKNRLNLGFDENSKVLVKDLRVLKVPFELLVQIDNSEECTLLNRDNALIISPYIPSMNFQEAARRARTKCGNNNNRSSAPVEPFGGTAGCGEPEEDEVLLSLISFLESLLAVPDVRSVLRHGRVF